MSRRGGGAGKAGIDRLKIAASRHAALWLSTFVTIRKFVPVGKHAPDDAVGRADGHVFGRLAACRHQVGAGC